MTSSAHNRNSGNQRNQDNLNAPPMAPTLAPRQYLQDFLVSEHDISRTQKIWLLVESPTQPQDTNPNDISMYFKKLMTLLCAVDKKMVLMNWDDPTQNSIMKAMDIQLSREEISHYFLGMRVLANSKKLQVL